MASTTAHYQLTTDVQTDDFIEPSHQNRVADTVDRVLGGFLKNVMTAGVHEGWEIDNAKTVSAGQGLVDGCWCETPAAQSISGLTDAMVNYVFAVPNEASAPDGTMAFVAQPALPGPAGAVMLGTIELASDGSVVAVDNEAEGSQRTCHQLTVVALAGSGTIQNIPAESTVEELVSHEGQGDFRVPGDLRVASSDSGFEWHVSESHRGDCFTFEVTNLGAEAATFSYTWTREGFAR